MVLALTPRLSVPLTRVCTPTVWLVDEEEGEAAVEAGEDVPKEHKHHFTCTGYQLMTTAITESEERRGRQRRRRVYVCVCVCVCVGGSEEEKQEEASEVASVSA